ncbi:MULTISPECIES: serine/threonine-protein kinase [unclassified Pseudomonas]|uniref:serine/threonine-protein kinase n=1 Tax=unclassified Pseudomonas TaxID=196821 RepID=UPI001199EA11|nr:MULTISPECIES: serine/threonine-protein kinase [unclassified Pseudomonas]TWC11729.1 serine/threonine-protein kinase PpkA [Pseudomonas sp. SJZ074]TWC14585.1 serine/threonine-protein kinase PpkA [Pseudomonas sp. SJZ075]TWC30488.1 serine/threonine-protein kinase PpkA [Pseudomonas sp. SJZ085]TWC31003.1 serine/threonine-protein kinase PpkA [Pseudomonas sp. SJZ078]TWC51893.1 serine/threonine-protein kinase PpkA [Pseudomonas sp. SJZ124]
MNPVSNIQIPGYDIDGEIGEGAMASVYLATQRSLERKVALKVMAAALAADPTFCERFLREGKTLARLSHPHTVTIHDIGNVGELYYMAMEYLPNGTLKERIAAGLSPEQGLVYIRQIASALGYAHGLGLVHRDVKPANILFRADGTAVLSDFGIAKSLDDRTQFTQAGFAVGTPSYMSPEQARGQDIDGRADLYALGVVLYEILVGKLPYTGNDALSTALAHLTEPLPELPVHHGRYQDVLRKLLAKDPAERFPDAAALLRALDNLPQDSEATLIRPMPIPVPPVAKADDLAGLTPMSIDIPSGPAQPQSQPRPTPPPVSPPARPVVAPSRKPPVFALAAVAVAVTLALGGAGYWWLSGDSGKKDTKTPIASTSSTKPPVKTPDAPPVKTPDTTPAQPPVSPPLNPPVATQADGGQRPLLMAGKKTLFQRVLSKPGATLVDEPGAAPGKALPAFSVLYVYQRKDVNGSPWVRVGAATDGRSDGWLPAAQVSDWKQSLVLKFTERSGRAPVMFLRQPGEVEKLLANPSNAKNVLLKAQQNPTDNQQVLALEPAASAVPQNQFYLLPIFDSRESFDENGQPVQLLNVASIDPGSTPRAASNNTPILTANADAFRTAVVLVVDTTVSMQPYIDQVRDVVHELQTRIAERGELDSVSFGLVGFRSSVKKTPGLEYVAKTLITLEQGRDPQRFLDLARQVKASTVSSHSFNEDAFAGVMEAVEGMDWSGYGGRLILLITDAGALRKNDPFAATQMNEAEVRQAALGKQIKIYALHLLSDAGKKTHAGAQSQYRTLTADANPQIGDLYIPVAGADVRKLGERVDEIGSVFADLVHQVRSNKPQSVPALGAAPSLADKSAAVGYAMHMDFLGRKTASQAPQLVSAWTADRDLTNPALPAFQVCVMLTKLQLNDLQQSLKLIVDAARKTQSSPKDFFQEIASASAYMSRDPSALRKGGNLADGGILGEYLEGLPYRSKSLNMTQDLWLSLSVAEQEDFIDELDSKIRLYETFHNDLANWVRFGDAEPGDALYRVPLSTLP